MVHKLLSNLLAGTDQTNTAKNVGICYKYGRKKLSEPLLSRFRAMHLNEYSFSQFYEISVKKLLAEVSVWEQLPNPNIRNYVQIGPFGKE